MPDRKRALLPPGEVHRTAALRRWDSNPSRLAERLEARGELQRLGHGFVYVPRWTRFGPVPPTDESLLDAFFDGTPYVVTGPLRWNALGLGSTALHVRPLVYNTKRTGTLTIGARTFDMRRVAFPVDPMPEWFVVDLLRNAGNVGVDRADLLERLTDRVARGQFERERLLDMAARFGRGEEMDLLRLALAEDAA